MGIAVKRYPLPVPEWCRTIWPSPKAREIWEPRVSAISAARVATELATVGPVRLAARQTIAPSQFPEFSRKAAARGLVAVALSQEPTSGSYQARPTGAAINGDAWGFQAALCATPAAARAFVRAWEASNDGVIGHLLGFPPCCIEAFKRIWIDEQWLDTTWPMARASMHRALGAETEVEIHPTAPVEANILLRWLGVRWVPHLPCSFDCAGTVALGQQFRAVMRDGFAREAAWLDELLDSSIEWSAWHGIAEIKTPVFKISAKTDATVERLIVQRPGRRVPDAAATGNAFPYNKLAGVVAPLTFHGLSGVISKPTMALVADTAPEVVVACDPAEWTDNGFKSRASMTLAHNTIRTFFREFITSATDARVLDLGCGNGRLVSALTTNAAGVEVDIDRCERAEEHGVVAYAMSIADFVHSCVPDAPFDAVLLMPGRLIEMKPPEALEVRRWLYAHAKRVIVYAYGDWIKSRAGGLAALCKHAGVTMRHEGYTQNQHAEGGPDVAVGELLMEALA